MSTLLLLLCVHAHADPLPADSPDQINQNFKVIEAEKFSIGGGTITGPVTISTGNFYVQASGSAVCFPDGTCQTTAAPSARVSTFTVVPQWSTTATVFKVAVATITATFQAGVVEVKFSGYADPTNNNRCGVSLLYDGNFITGHSGDIGHMISLDTAGDGGNLTFIAPVTVTAGSHSFALTAKVGANTCNSADPASMLMYLGATQ